MWVFGQIVEGADRWPSSPGSVYGRCILIRLTVSHGKRWPQTSAQVGRLRGQTLASTALRQLGVFGVL